MVTKGKRKRCPNCDTYRTNKMGILRTKTRKLQKYRCLECGTCFTREI